MSKATFLHSGAVDVMDLVLCRASLGHAPPAFSAPEAGAALAASFSAALSSNVPPVEPADSDEAARGEPYLVELIA